MNKDVLKDTIVSEASDFDLDKFYSDNIDRAALILITPVETISLIVPSMMNHTSLLKEIFYLKYNKMFSNNYKNFWFKEVPSTNSIVLSLVYDGIDEVVIPNKTNEREINEYINLKRKLESIKNRSYVYINIENDALFDNLDIGLQNIYERIDNNLTSNEEILDKESRLNKAYVLK